jgi:ABC-type multidrug transport system permease subunit
MQHKKVSAAEQTLTLSLSATKAEQARQQRQKALSVRGFVCAFRLAKVIGSQSARVLTTMLVFSWLAVSCGIVYFLLTRLTWVINRYASMPMSAVDSSTRPVAFLGD